MKPLHTSTLLVFFFLAAGLLVSSCGKKGEASTRTDINDHPVNVEVLPLETTSFDELIQATGTVQSTQDVMVPAEEGGRLLKWLVAKGARVAAGQSIARLDDALLKAGFEAAQAQYKIAQTNYEKQKRVFDENAISELQLKTIEYQRDAAKAQMDLAKARLDRTVITSPITGVLDDRLIDAGEMVGMGTPVAHMVELQQIKIAAGIPERYAGVIKIGDPVSFTIDAYPGERFSGKIGFVGAAVSKDNRTFPIEIMLSNPGMKLKPDMIAALDIKLATRPNSIVIESDYIQHVDKDRYVVYVEKEGRAEERVLTLGGTNGNRVQVLSGLQAGDRLITLGFQNVAQGQRVSVQN